MKFYSQAGQDIWVCQQTDFKKGGFFVEVGAYDGVQTSNTYFLEQELGWSGICIEANPFVFNHLQKNRKSQNINCAASSFNGECFFEDDKICDSSRGYSIRCLTLNSILEVCDAPNVIDYVSIDIEGHEYDVLERFDFSRWHINYITLEHNLYLDGPKNKNRLFELLSSKGFDRIVEDAPCLDPHPSVFGKPYEDWYANKEIK